MKRVKVAPSLMCADFLNLKVELDLMKEMGIDYLHIDIMDGHYVPNFSLGPDFCRKVSDYSPIPLDIHLMVENPDAYIPLFAGFRNAVVCIHPETSYHPLRSLELIRSLGAKAGIALDPALPVGSVLSLLPYASLACVMTVNPGFAAQKLIPETLAKIAELAELGKTRNYPIEIEVDGNVSWENVPGMVGAGAEVLVAGTSSLFEKGSSLRANIHRLFSLIGREQG